MAKRAGFANWAGCKLGRVCKLARALCCRDGLTLAGGTNHGFARLDGMPARILVVEDDLLNRMFYHEVLEARGHEVAEVADGALVLEEVARFAPDLITMDIQLPHISGLRLIRILQEDAATRTIPILAITAFAGPEEEQRAMAAGAHGYLAKPVSVSRLASAVEGLLRTAA